MSEFKGTPGPWFVTGNMTRFVEARIEGFLLQEVAACGPTAADEGYGPQQEANARLIAAAPELLEALQRLKCELILSDVDMGYIESHFRPSLNKATAAIAKALGQ